MSSLLKNISIYFTAGVIGTLIKTFVVIFIARHGLHSILSSSVVFSTSQFHIYRALIFGGLWGLCFFLPIKNIFLLKGIVISIIYSAFLLLYYFPVVANDGIFASDYGGLAWIYIVFINLIWGVFADLFVRLAK